MKTAVIAAAIVIAASAAQAQTPCPAPFVACNPNFLGYWGQGFFDTSPAQTPGASVFVWASQWNTLADAQSKPWTGFISRDTTNVVGGVQNGMSQGSLLIENIVGPGNNIGEIGAMIWMDNKSATGENTALNVIAIKETPTGPTWGIAIDAKEMAPASNPTEGMVPLEVSYSAKGTDDNDKRSLMNMMLKTQPGGADAVARAGIIIGTEGNSRI